MMPKREIVLNLLKHSWISFRRAHYFQRSLGVKTLMGFTALIFLSYLYAAGLMLPALLQNYFPELLPHEAFFSLWLYLFFAELTVRLVFQKLPRQMVQAYLTLPVKRRTLAGYILTRSWFSIYNVYLYALLLPFYYRTLYLHVSPAAFWMALLGTFLLSSLNHAITIGMRTWPARLSRTITLALFLFGFVILGGILYMAEFMEFSRQMGQAVISGQPMVFIILLSLIIVLQLLAFRGLFASFYEWSGAPSRPGAAGRSSIARFLAAVPIYGLYWELEWQLITRNKRAVGGLKQWPWIIIALPLFFYFDPFGDAERYMYLMVMAAGGYGFAHLQYVFSWESRFFDLIAARKIDMEVFIRSKYYFYLTMGAAQALPVLLLVGVLRPDLFWPLFGIFLYAVGPVFAYLFLTGVNSSTRINPNKKAGFNPEGTSGTLFLVIFVSMFSVLILQGIVYILPFSSETGLALLTGLIGLVFILTHRWWIAAVSKKFVFRKYHNLKKYRE